MRLLSVVVLTTALCAGCVVPEAAKRVTAGAARDAKHALKAHPETPAVKRLVLETEALLGWTGTPRRAVSPENAPESAKDEEVARDVQELLTISSGLDWLLAFAPGWLGTLVTTLTGIGGVAALAFSGRYLLAGRRLLGIITDAIEKRGSKDLKKTISKATKGTNVAGLLDKLVKKAESANGKGKATA